LKVADAEYQKNKALAKSNKALCEQYQKEFDSKDKEWYETYEAYAHFAECQKLAEYEKVVAENNKKIPQFQHDLAAKRTEIETLEKQIKEIRDNKEKERKQYQKLETEIKLIKQQIVPISDICPTCGQKLSKEKYDELTAVVKENEKKLEGLVKEQQKHIVYDDKDDWTLMPLVSKVEELKKESATIESALLTMTDNVSSFSEIIENLSKYKKFSSMSEKELKDKFTKLFEEKKKLEEKIADLSEENTAKDVTEDLKKAEEDLKRENVHKTDLLASIKVSEKENERYAKELKSVENKKKELKKLQDKIVAYNFIEETFSNKGIPAIELRESAPEIADITNQILRNSYGNKFEIRFGSSSELKSKKKADEDFNIIVTDTVNDDEKTIDLVSSGERIWIKQALFYAFSIVQMNRTGFNFRTRFIDESDGSIDGTLRPKYLKMVESAHHISNSRITILITHSQEIKDIAQQIIEV